MSGLAAASVAIAGAALAVETVATGTVIYPMVLVHGPRSARAEADTILEQVSNVLKDRGDTMDEADFEELKMKFEVLHDTSKDLDKKKTSFWSFMPVSSYKKSVRKYRNGCRKLERQTSKTSTSANRRLIRDVVPHTPASPPRRHSMEIPDRAASIRTTVLDDRTEGAAYYMANESVERLLSSTGAPRSRSIPRSGGEGPDGVELQSVPSSSSPITPPRARVRFGRAVRRDTDVDFV